MKNFYIISILLICVQVKAQEYPRREIDLSKVTDELLGLQDGDSNYEELYENLIQLLSNPLDLNKATSEQLRQLHILSENQIISLDNHFKNNGALLSVYELQSVPYFEVEDIQRIAPFIVVQDPKSIINKNIFSRVVHEKSNYFIVRYDKTLQKKRGFLTEDENQRFKGSDSRIYYRFRSSRPGDFSVGFTVEQDAGETFQWSPSSKKYGVDYLSYHIQLLNKGKIKNIIIGNYQAQFGQGLTLGGAFGVGKGGETVATTRKSNIGFVPYTSTNEAGYFNGIATTYTLTSNIHLSAFFSKAYKDATVNEDGSSSSSLTLTGLHRNSIELAKRKSIQEQNKGFIFQYQRKLLDAGFIIHQTTFNIPLETEPLLYNQFSFHGDGNMNTGLYINYSTNNLTFFSEASQSLHHGYGLVGGILVPVSKFMDMSLLYRKYQRNFYSFYGNAFAETSKPENESGFYWGWKYSFSKKYVLAGYMDIFRFPWLKFRSYAPTSGYETLMKFTFQPSKNIITFLQMRRESKTRNKSNEENLYQTSTGVKSNYTFQAEYNHEQRLKLKTRIQANEFYFDNKRTSGLLISQDVSYTFNKFQCTARHAIFHTDDYDNRLYVYENDVWLAYSLPAYDGTGVRNYILLEYKMNKKISLWLRYSKTRYIDREQIGSGLDTIEGNVKSDIKVQCLMRL